MARAISRHNRKPRQILWVFSTILDVPASFRRDVRAADLIVANRHVLRDGGHEPEGIFLLRGPTCARRVGFPSTDLAIALTVLEILACPSRTTSTASRYRGLHGGLSACAPAAAESKPAAITGTTPNQPEYSEEDSAKVEERLGNLVTWTDIA